MFPKYTPLKALFFYLLLPLFYFLSLLPFPVLYGVSRGLYWILYRALAYRKKVVTTNLQNAFPEKSAVEIKQISKNFYRHLSDLIVETLKTLSLSKTRLSKRAYFHPTALQLFQTLAEEGKSVIALMGHQGNWEWAAPTFGTQIPQKLFVVYRPLSHSFFDRLMYAMRARFEVQPVPMNQILRTLLAERAIPSTTAFIADQAPMPAGAYWTSFLNQDTPFFMGAEKIARKLNSPVVYVRIKKEKKGHYQIFAKLLEAEPAQTAAGAIMESFAQHLQADICAQPETWLWSHRRWKHSRTVPQN